MLGVLYKQSSSKQQMTNICLFLFIGLSVAFNYSTPIMINSGISNISYPINYDQYNDLILYGSCNTIHIYDLMGNLVNQFNTVSIITSMDITTDNSILVLTTPDNIIFEYDYSGTLIKKTFFGGYNGGDNQVLCNHKSNNFYVWYTILSYYIVYSFNENHNLISHTFIDRDVSGWAGFDIGTLTGNLMFSTYQTIQIYNNTLDVLMNITPGNSDDVYPYTYVIDITDNIVCYSKKQPSHNILYQMVHRYLL